MFGLQPIHLLIILIVALLIFGPSRLPEIGRSLGKTINEFRSATREATQGIQEEIQKPIEPRMEEPKVKCKQCGKPLQAGMKFCPDCGSAQ